MQHDIIDSTIYFNVTIALKAKFESIWNTWFKTRTRKVNTILHLTIIVNNIFTKY